MSEPKVAPTETEVKSALVPVERGPAEGLAPRQRQFTLVPTTLEEAMDFSKVIASSELCPKEYRGKPGSVLIAVQMGAEIGIPPMQALQNIAVINGRPTMWGDLVLGLVQVSGLLESIEERDPQEALGRGEGRCEVVRRGAPVPVVRTFTVEMAEKAGLIKRGGPDAPWTAYRGRMLQMRARSWALRDAFADVLKGLQFREEVDDYPPPAEPIQMPRRRSERAKLEEFSKGTAAAVPAAEPATAEKPAPSGNVWTGRVAGVDERNGTTKGGKSYTLYTVRAADGEKFTTFDSKAARFAREAGTDAVRVMWEPSKDGKFKNVLSIEPHVEEAPGDDREPGSDDK